MRTKRITLSLAALFAAALLLPATSAFAAGAGGTVEGTVHVRPSKYTAGVVVYLSGVPGNFRPPPRPAQMDQQNMKFIPHVLAIVKGTTVAFLNSDNIRHNVFSPDANYDLGTWPQGTKKYHTFKTAGVFHQLCHIHPEMSAVIVVLNNPYFAVVGQDGHFAIKNVPAGTYTLKAWSEKLPGATKRVIVAAGRTTKLSISVHR